MPRTNNRRTPRHSNAPRHALLGAGHGVLCVCVLVCPAAKLPSEVDGSKYVPSRRRRRPLACCHKSSRQAGVQGRQARTFPPCCCCCNKHNERLRNAHFIRCPPLVRCSSLARPPSPTPHTHATHVYYTLYILCIYSSIPHTTLAAAAAASHHHPPPPAEKKKSTHYICIL